MYQKDYDEYIKAENGLISKFWKKGLPDKPGIYWLYSYRYGKISCGVECEKELHMLEIQELNSGVMLKADGQFVWENELEEPYWRELYLPLLPSERNTVNEKFI